jgi:bifunctional oligoribonuclease and PAP phosphatase NrnA
MLNTTRLRELALASRRVLLTGPTDPDGDSIGACLALARSLRQLGVPEVVVAGTPGFRYAWMPGADAMVPDERVQGPFDLAVVMDGDRHRLSPPVDAAFHGAATTAIVDHHDTTRTVGYTLALIDRTAASTCGMVLEVMDAWGLALDPTQAELLYAGIIFDTGGFRYSNTGANTHRVAARLLDQGIDQSAIAIRVLMERRHSGMLLKSRVVTEASFLGDGALLMGVISAELLAEVRATRGDVEGIVESMLYIEGVQVSVLLVERGPSTVKLSLRSRGRVDVARVARTLHSSGGGHQKAAGVTLDEALVDVRARVPGVVLDALAGRAAG